MQLRVKKQYTSLLGSPSLKNIVGGRSPSWSENEYSNANSTFEGCHRESNWINLEAGLHHWTKALCPVQLSCLKIRTRDHLHC
ncbi:DAR GTPase 3, chloroplastic [Quillaja saponaria]|uniref:DAR GTPase 3, chloroplastic n=1 Tax=Quillaja saponaria TaxID=32244 RepID=A0AAD7LKG0_QUISA|nr:DAR GTPase 3, chloroplastic [Quillaja saponaria]